jgi:hypothetical protein
MNLSDRSDDDLLSEVATFIGLQRELTARSLGSACGGSNVDA